MDSLGARLKLARDTRGLTQDQLEAASGVKQSDITKLERGKSLTTTALPALARALQCDVDWLDTGEGDPDFGRVLRGWPFPSIERARFAALLPEQRLEIQGVVRKMITDFEQAPVASTRTGLRAVPPAPDLDLPHLDEAAPLGKPPKPSRVKRR